MASHWDGGHANSERELGARSCLNSDLILKALGIHVRIFSRHIEIQFASKEDCVETGWIEEITKGASFWNVITLWLMVKITRLKRVGQVVGLPQRRLPVGGWGSN